MPNASEKLRELDARYNLGPAELSDYGPHDEYATVLVNILPLIADVVEAADKAAASLHLTAHVADIFRLSSVLRKLDEALGEE